MSHYEHLSIDERKSIIKVRALRKLFIKEVLYKLFY